MRARALQVLCSLLFWIITVQSTQQCTDETNQENECAMSKLTVKQLCEQSNTESIVDSLSAIYEHSRWVAEALVQDDRLETVRTLERVTDLAALMKQIVDQSSREQKLTLLRAHPDLCSKLSTFKTLTADSQQEQSRSGLQNLTDEERSTFEQYNSQYRDNFGFPFILAVRNASKHTVLAALKGRVHNTPEVEFTTALEQVHKIAWMRLLALFDTSDANGFLTCHVLDTANGVPAVGMRIELKRLSEADTILVGTYVTNNDGRLEGGPALKGGAEMIVGTYEWTFYTGEYFASMGTFTAGTPFLDVVPLRFGIDSPDDHYHVPLLVSPWSYSTYRGS